MVSGLRKLKYGVNTNLPDGLLSIKTISSFESFIAVLSFSEEICHRFSVILMMAVYFACVGVNAGLMAYTLSGFAKSDWASAKV